MSGHAQQAIAKLVLETVHHRQHDNQCGYAEGHPHHRSCGDKRSKLITAALAQVAQGNKNRDGSLH